MVVKNVSKTACDGKKFFIEVTGVNHPKEQFFEFYDLSDMSQQSALTNKKEPDPELDDTTVYSWNWQSEKENRNVWLKIEAEGSPIKVPLFSNVTDYKRKSGTQDYLVHAVVPVTSLPPLGTVSYERALTAPVRTGFIYIAYNGKIWREVEASVTEEGSPCFRDVRLYSYREGRDKPFQTRTARKVTGKPLKDIWYPAKAGGEETDIRIAYSEVPWSGARLNYLESNPDELNLRMSKVSAKLPVTTELPEMRPRELGVELMLAKPAEYIYDLSGEVLLKAYQHAKSILKNDFREYSDSGQYQYAAYTCVLSEQLAKAAEQELDTSEFWDPDKANDIHAEAKKRKLRYVQLDDPVQNLRQLSSTLQYSVNFYQQLQLDAANQPDFNSAQLVNAFILATELGEQENPLYKFRDEFDSGKESVFAKTLRISEREKCAKDIAQLQDILFMQLSDKRLATVLRDISSLDDANGLGGHILVNRCWHGLLFSPEMTDSLLPKQEFKLSTMTEKVSELFSQHQSDIRRVIFPDKPATLDGPYIPPEPENNGSGWLTLEQLANWSGDNLLLEPEALIQLEAMELVKNAEGPKEGELGQIRRIFNAVDSVFSSFFTASLSLQQALLEGTQTISFNSLYADSLAMSKALVGDPLKTLTYTPVTGSTVSGFVIGVSGLGEGDFGVKHGAKQYPYGSRGSKNSFGDVMLDGEKVFNTNKSKFKKSSQLVKQREVSLTVLLDDQSLAADYLKRNPKALEDLDSQKLNRSNAYEKLRMPFWVMVVELINVRNAIVGMEENFDKDPYYSISNLLSAAFDIGIAGVQIHNQITRNAGYFVSWSDKTVFQSNPKTVERFNSFIQRTLKMDVRLVSSISRLAALSFSAGIITAGMFTWDAIRFASRNDTDAAIGAGVMALGGVISATGTFFGGSASVFSMGPVGFLGLAIVFVGWGITYYFTDSSLEIWLKNGPFSYEKCRDSDLVYLQQEPETAYHQLLSLITSLTVSCKPLAQLPIKYTEKEAFERQGVTHGVYVRSNLAQLMNLREVDIHLAAEQVIEQYQRIEKPVSPYYVESTKDELKVISTTKRKTIEPISEIHLAEGCLYLFKNTLKVPRSTMTYQGDIYHYRRNIHARVQFRAEDIIFPQPPIDKVLQAREAIAEGKLSADKPDFLKEDDYYWADSADYQDKVGSNE